MVSQEERGRKGERRKRNRRILYYRRLIKKHVICGIRKG
jgi:hypothetical protein